MFYNIIATEKMFQNNQSNTKFVSREKMDLKLKVYIVTIIEKKQGLQGPQNLRSQKFKTPS